MLFRSKIDKKYDELKKQNESSKELLSDFKFMKGIDTLEQFKEEVRKCSFWADYWVINMMEILLNIKFIILSSETYKEGDYPNVLKCGGVIDPILEEKGEFKPEFYIIVEYTGNHYKLITYKDKSIFNFKEIPYDLKQIIVEKCMEGDQGVYSLIPEFKKHKKTFEGIPSGLLTNTDTGLYNENIVLMFYSGSSSKPFPGKGNGENIEQNDVHNFYQLHKTENWRRILDNEWISSFEIDGKEWASVEHYVQASKFKYISEPEYLDFFGQFSLDSDSDLSKNIDMAKMAGKPTKTNKIRPKGILIDPKFYPDGEENAMKKAIYAKFSQNELLKNTLLNTKNAKLLKYQRGQEPELCLNLMEVRRKLIIENS